MQKTELSKIKKIYFNPAHPASFSNKRKLWLATKKCISQKNIENFLESQDSYTINRPSRRKFSRLHYEINNIGDLWQIDLIDFRNLKKYNNGFSYILVCIDVFSKFLWMEKMEKKTGDEALTAFKKILGNKTCLNLMSDSGTEFLNKKFISFVKSKEINFFQNVDDSTHCSIAERVILTFKRKLFMYFRHKNTLKYIDVYKKICNAYNSSFHSSIGMTPKDVNDGNIVEVYKNLHLKYNKPVSGKVKISANSYVRISLRRNLFSKPSAGQNFSEEIFQVSSIQKHKPPVYTIKDLLGEEVIGKFYGNELQPVSLQDNKFFKIDKIVGRRVHKGRRQVLVKWTGYPKKFSSWINQEDIENI